MGKIKYPHYLTSFKKRMRYYVQVAPAQRILRHVRINVSAKVQGRTYKIPLESGVVGSGKLFREREANVADVIARLLEQRRGVVIDVGINIGQTLLVVKRFDASRRYIGFEPNPDCSVYVKNLCSLNSISNVTLVSCGLSESAGLMSLYLRDGYSDTASVVEDFRPKAFYNRVISVPMLNGDASLSALDGLEEICFIKVDVEGAELQVLSGLKNTLAVKGPPVIFEVLPDRIFMTGEKLDREQARIRRDLAEEIDKLLRSLGYRINRILKDGSLSEIESLNRERDVPLSECNYLALRDS